MRSSVSIAQILSMLMMTSGLLRMAEAADDVNLFRDVTGDRQLLPLLPPALGTYHKRQADAGHGQDVFPSLGNFCDREGFLGDALDCTKFYRCVENGPGFTRFQFTCASGTIWDAGLETCNHPSEVTSSTCGQHRETEENGVDEGYSYNEIPYYDSQPQNVEREPYDLNQYDQCPGEGYFGDSERCGDFYRCVDFGTHFVKYPFSCGPNVVWDAASESCNHPWAVTGKCFQPLEVPTIYQELPDCNPLDYSLARPPPNDCWEEGYIRHPSDCQLFFRCVQGANGLDQYSFACTGSKVWDENVGSCNDAWAVLSPCGSAAAPQPGTQVGSTEVETPGMDVDVRHNVSEIETTTESRRTITNDDRTSTTTILEATTNVDVYRTPDQMMTTSESERTTSTESTEIVKVTQEMKTTYLGVNMDTTESDDRSTSSTVIPESSTFDVSIASTISADTTSIASSDTTTSEMSTSETTSSTTLESSTTSTIHPEYSTFVETTDVSLTSTISSDPSDSSESTASEISTSSTISSDTTSIASSDSTTSEMSTSETSSSTTLESSTTSTIHPEYSTFVETSISTDVSLTSTISSDSSESTASEMSTSSIISSDPTSTGSSDSTTNEMSTSSTTLESSTPSTILREYSTLVEKSISTDVYETSTSPDGSTTNEIHSPISTMPSDSTTDSITAETNPKATSMTSETTSYSESITSSNVSEMSTEISTLLETSTSELLSESFSSLMSSTSTEMSSSSTPCPVGKLMGEQIALVCPTGFKRHPKYCNLFYQCTMNEKTFEMKLVVLSCPKGTIYDDDRIQCLPAEEAQPCPGGNMASKRVTRTLKQNSMPLVPVETGQELCPSLGFHPLQAYINEGCNNLFIKCDQPPGFTTIQGYVFQCPEEYFFDMGSKRCDRRDKAKTCSSGKLFGEVWDIPVANDPISFLFSTYI